MLAYTQLGQKEDPEFTVKAMLVQAAWPGSPAQQMSEQVTDKLEKKLQEVAEIDTMTSYVKPGLTQITITLREDTRPEDVPQVGYQVRKKLGDIRPGADPIHAGLDRATAGWAPLVPAAATAIVA